MIWILTSFAPLSFSVISKQLWDLTTEIKLIHRIFSHWVFFLLTRLSFPNNYKSKPIEKRNEGKVRGKKENARDAICQGKRYESKNHLLEINTQLLCEAFQSHPPPTAPSTKEPHPAPLGVSARGQTCAPAQRGRTEHPARVNIWRGKKMQYVEKRNNSFSSRSSFSEKSLLSQRQEKSKKQKSLTLTLFDGYWKRKQSNKAEGELPQQRPDSSTGITKAGV